MAWWFKVQGSRFKVRESTLNLARCPLNFARFWGLWAVILLWGGVALAPSTSSGQAVPPFALSPAEGVEVTGVHVTAADPSSASLLISASGLITHYESFSLPDPPRLVIQIPNAVHAIPQPITAQGGPIATIRSSQYRETPTKIVRVILDLIASLPYRVEAVGDQLKVLIGEPVAEAPSAEMAEILPPPPAIAPISPVPPEAPEPAPSPIEAVEVPKPVPAIEAPKPVEAPKAPAVPPVVERPPIPMLPQVVEVPKPVPAPAPSPVEAVEVPKPAEVPEVPKTPEAPPRISMDFKDADLGNILRIIAEVSGKNIVAGEEVKGKVTVRLTNVEWRQALDVILSVSNFGHEEVDNIIRVTSLAAIQKERAEKEKLVTEVEKRRLEEPPPDPKTFIVNFAKVSEIAKHFDRLKKHPKASIIPDERTSMLIVRDTEDAIKEMEGLLKQLDVSTPQVLIEARIVEATRTFTQSLGVTWGGARQSRFGSAEGQLLNVFGTTAGPPLTAPVISPLGPVPLFVNFPALGPAPVALGIVVGSLANRFVIGAQLSAAENEGRIKTLSAPKITTLDNEEAEMKQGTQVPFTTIDTSGRTVISFIDAFIRLKVKPHITPDKRVSMKVEAERSFTGPQINFTGGFSFPIETRKATTNILVPSGGTIVIGGLFQSQESTSEDRVPFLSRIPVLGWLFKRHNVGPDARIELLIFLTPTVLEALKIS